MADSMNDNLVKLASDLTDRVEQLEAANARLIQANLGLVAEATLKQGQSKTASQEKAVSEETVDKTLDLMVKAGALDESQVAEGKQYFMTDPEAPHRILQRLLDAQIQTKTASAQEEVPPCGEIASVSNVDPITTKQAQCLDAMVEILGMR